MWPRSIRTRLTLWYAGILALILVALAGGTYFTMRRALIESLDDALENRAFLTSELLIFDAQDRPGLDWPEDDPDLDDTFQRIFDADGRVLFDNSGAAFDDPEVQQRALSRAAAGSAHRGTIGRGDARARVLTTPIVHEGRIVGSLQTGELTGDIDEPLRILALVFAVGLPLALVLAGGGGYWLSSRALAPIDQVTKAAREISEHDLSRRLALDLPDDEVGRLARTFDCMIARLDAAFERQRQFTGDASHELRTPLTAIRGQIDVALQRPRDAADYQQVLATINDQVERMTRLVGGLLLLARSDAGVLPAERALVDIAALVTSVGEQVRPLAAGKGLALDVVGEGTPSVSGDRDLLLQLLLNLADNAIKYTAEGSVTLGWRAGASVGRVELFVRDTGPGIPAEEQARVFERFYRVDAARSGTSGGAGLGLAIARWIAEAHGGSLTLVSSPAGSAFTTELPVA